jgi:predicted CXXCH cytochrome family protein
MKTKHLGAGLIAGAALTLLASAAVAGIEDTKHNLSNAGLGTQANSFSGTGEICVFCHTPHGADDGASVPLWNRVLDATPGTTYTTYDALGTTTLDGEVLDVGSVSIACLSCHDGTQAMNVMINAPGSGSYDPDGFTLAGTWTGNASTATPTGSLAYATDSVVNLSTDLQNDHPIGIEYGGGGCTNGAAGTTCTPTGDADFNDATRPAATGTGAVQWFVDVDGGGTRDKNDMILYSRAFTAGAGPSVECASCHDPHVSGTDTFLRTANTGSAVCLACHDK